MATDEGDDRFDRLDAALEAALTPFREQSGPIVLLFSGGIDSALLAHALSDTGRLRLWTIGLVGSPEEGVARSAARALGLSWAFGAIDRGSVARAVERWAPAGSGLRGPSRSVAVALALAIQSAPAGPIVTGQGADELFLGYAHFRGIDAEAAADRSRSDLDRLDREDGPWLERIAGELGRSVGAPFTHPAVRAAVERWSIAERMPGLLTKPLLREWARRRGVPEPILGQPKRAIQFGTGVDRLLRGLDRNTPELP